MRQCEACWSSSGLSRLAIEFGFDERSAKERFVGSMRLAFGLGEERVYTSAGRLLIDEAGFRRPTLFGGTPCASAECLVSFAVPDRWP